MAGSLAGSPFPKGANHVEAKQRSIVFLGGVPGRLSSLSFTR